MTTHGFLRLPGLLVLGLVSGSACGRGGFDAVAANADGWFPVTGFDAAISQGCPGDWFYRDPPGGCSLFPVAGEAVLREPVSAFFTPSIPEYRAIRGRIRGFQDSSTDAFSSGPHDGSQSTLDTIYVDGVSITVGSPRVHVWTFAAGFADSMLSYQSCGCPCTDSEGVPAPDFVGDDWVCDSSNPVDTPWPQGWVLDPPLWTHGNANDCAAWSAERWFVRELPVVQTGPIEVRIMLNQEAQDEDLVVTRVELEVR